MEATVAVRQVVTLITYGHKDATTFLTPYVLSTSYTDKLKGESDELEIQVEDRDGRWRADGYPTKGDEVSVKLGYDSGPLMASGSFTVDEVELTGPPDTVSIKGLATSVTNEARTKRSAAYENQTLKQLAAKVAGKHGLKVVGTVGDLAFERITQNEETDLAFLKRIATAYGYVFSVRGNQLVFHDRTKLDSGKTVLQIHRSDIKAYSLKDRSSGVYRGVEVAYFSPKTHKLVNHIEHSPGVKKGDILKLVEHCENLAQAKARAKAALRDSHAITTKGKLTLPGEVRLVSGINIELLDMGRLSGTYQVSQSKHTTSRKKGYEVEIEVSRVPGA